MDVVRRRTDEVYERLRAEIIRGDLRPREALSEIEIAERLQVSRTPVRESLQRLDSEGLITSHRRRWIVYEHSIAEIREIYEVRAALEGYSARLACQRATEDELAELTELRVEAANADLESDKRVDLNEHLHDTVLRFAHNGTLLKQARTSRLFFFNRRVAQLYTQADLRVSATQHQALLDAILHRDAPAAEAAAREHVEYALELILRKMS
ncbi:MAG TPA: GntR family transcriptional regulator [Pseudonocardia sp.]|jgi:DNA-binding GntR family transcriptional regulator|nr:GntR family transcriptional regulator [Pseudonocardia sp.]